MADKEQVLRDAYRYFDDWTEENKNKFAELLTDDVVWIEGDEDMGVRTYQRKPEVLQHLDEIRNHLVLAELRTVEVHGQQGTTTDEMQAQGHPEAHGCVTDVIFRDDLIAHVHHCLRRS